MRSLRSLLVCPCWRCREAREEERNRKTPEEVRAILERVLESDSFTAGDYTTGTSKWREAVEKRAHEWG